MSSKRFCTVTANPCSARSRSPSSTPPPCGSRAKAAPAWGNGAIRRTTGGTLNQVVLGSVLDGNDRPIASFLMPGNTADVTTLLPVVTRLEQRFGIRKACIVADRGMISAATIAALEARGIDYILGVRERSTAEVRTEVIEDDGVTVPLTIPRQKGETQIAVKEVKPNFGSAFEDMLVHERVSGRELV